LVSIIVPVFNARETISDCLESIQSLDYPKEKLEIIVVDNGSNDRSDEIAQKFKVEMLFETSMKSSYAARNKGVREAKGEMLAFTDADCVVSPGWLKHMVQHWTDSSIGCFAGEIKAFQPKTIIEKFSERKDILNQRHTFNNPYLPYAQTANVGFRKQVFEQIGLFDSEMKTGGDADFCWRMQKQTRFQIRFIPKAVVYHKHRDSVRGLYKQFQKYEYARKYWLIRYPDFPLPSKGKLIFELLRVSCKAILIFPINLIRWVTGKIDGVDLLSPFLACVMSVGTLSVRFSNKFFSRD